MKQTGIVGECKQSIISKDPLLLSALIALLYNNWVTEVDWHEEHPISSSFHH